VVFVQKFVPHYRLPLFELLKEKLAARGVEFVLIYGQPDPFEGSKIRMEFPSWGTRVKSLIIPLPGRYLYWQGAPFKGRKGDVVIVEHASKLLDNYVLFALQQIGFLRLCYFGHGRNFQDAHEIWVARKIKRLMVARVYRWFAYTQMSVDALVDQGVDPSIIVSVNNTLKHKATLDEGQVERESERLVYIGGLYKDKRIDFLLEAATLVQSRHPGFRLDIVGAGPQVDRVQRFADAHDWCDYHGEVYGEDRDRILFRSSAIAMPGLVGLVAVDAFHYASPVLTTNCGQHSPEVAYLADGVNSLILEDEGTPESYAAMIDRFLSAPALVARLREGCRASAKEYTIDATADRFVDAIVPADVPADAG